MTKPEDPRPDAPLLEDARLQDPLRESDSVRVWTEPMTLELREERALVEKLRESAGHVTVRRERRSHTETFSVELVSETLYITVEARGPAHPLAMLGDQELEPGRTYEVTLYREEAQVSKRPVVYEQVRIDKREVVEHRQIPVSLEREELDVETSPGIWQRPPEQL